MLYKYKPAHCEQTVAPIPLILPGEHVEQTDVEELSAKVPAEQDTHVSDGTIEYVPARHEVQKIEPRETLERCPGEHWLHIWAAEMLLYEPAVHSTGNAEPVGQYALGG